LAFLDCIDTRLNKEETIIKEILYKLSKIDNTRIIGVNTTEKEVSIELFVELAMEGTQENIQITKIVKEISKIIDEGLSQRHSIQVNDAVISIKIPVF
jgi:hypothetical protein